jgi:hypothetical protein
MKTIAFIIVDAPTDPDHSTRLVWERCSVPLAELP